MPVKDSYREQIFQCAGRVDPSTRQGIYAAGAGWNLVQSRSLRAFLGYVKLPA